MTSGEDRLRVALAERYTIEQEVGAGGMAMVYLAEDLKHDRKVAIKVLRPELAAVIGAERFLSEIKTTANLQHPHILPLFDSGEIDGLLFYVMPYVEGESLRDRLTREQQLPVAEAIRIASEVASALDYAHRHGVIHRDIKPENVLLHDGQALVADFGIALAVAKTSGHRMTETGMSLGTPHYMSPEQAVGDREITSRSDVYALGAITYEMLVGEPPFTGPTAQAIVAKVMTEKPVEPSRARDTVPEGVEEAILIALQKLPADRFGTAAEFAEALSGRDTAQRAGLTRGHPRAIHARSPVLIGGVGATLGAVLGAIAVLVLSDGSRSGLIAGNSTKVTWEPGLEVQPAISPDGKAIAYSAGTEIDSRIFLRQVSGGRVTRLTTNEEHSEMLPSWYPDGTRILYATSRGIFSVPAAGGTARQEVPGGGRGVSAFTSAAVSPDGSQIAYTVGDSLFLHSRDGNSRFVAEAYQLALCSWAPDGIRIACVSGNGLYSTLGTLFANIAPSQIVVVETVGGSIGVVTDSSVVNQSPAWTPDGASLLFVSDRHGPRDVYSVSMDGLEPTGHPGRITVGLDLHTISLSADGRRLAYSTYSEVNNIWRVPWRGGEVDLTEAEQVTRGNQQLDVFSVSDDGKTLLFPSDVSGNYDLYEMDLVGGESTQLTDGPAAEFAPDLSPDGRQVAYHSYQDGNRDIFILSRDGGPRQQVTFSPKQEFFPAWSPDGSRLAYAEFTSTGAVWVTSRADDGSWGSGKQVYPTGYLAQWSPDGSSLVHTDGLPEGSLIITNLESGKSSVLMDATIPGNPLAGQPYFSEDGNEVLFVGLDSTDTSRIWSMPTTGAGRPTSLLTFDHTVVNSFRPRWALRGDQIYFMEQDTESDIFVLEIGSE